MPTNPFPTPEWGTYPVTPYYYMRAMEQSTQYDCDPTGQDTDAGSINVLCSNYEGGGEWVSTNKWFCENSDKPGSEFLDEDVITHITCAVKQCSDLQQKYCQNGAVSLFDSDNKTVIGLCTHTDGEKNCVDTANDIEARPTSSDTPGDGVTKWYVGDESYLLGYSYQCTAAADNVSDYYNALCEASGAFSEDVHVYCSAEPADGIGGEEVSTSPYCGATTCADITDVTICTESVDLYTIDRETTPGTPVAVLYGTCIADGESCVNINGPETTTPDPDDTSGAASIITGIATLAGAYLML